MSKISGNLFGKRVFISTEDKKTAKLLLKILAPYFDWDSLKSENNTLVLSEKDIAEIYPKDSKGQ